MAVCTGGPSCWSVQLWWWHFARMSDNRPFSRTTWRSCWSLQQYWTDLSKIWKCSSDISGRITRGPRGPGRLKDRVAPWNTWFVRVQGASKMPPEITRQIQYMIATYQYHSKHRWWCTVPGYMINFAQFLIRRNQRCRLKTTWWPKKVSHKVLFISLPNIDRFLNFFHCCILWKICGKVVTPPHCVATLPCEIWNMYNASLFGEYMNKSLELNFLPILYDSIVFLSLQTQKVYLKQNVI